MWGRGLALVALGSVYASLWACSPDRTVKVPRDTPSCVESCEAAWGCGGVLENDLAACTAGCDDEAHGEYRICVTDTPCEEMYTCKIYGPQG